jgi:adenosine deaminase
VTLEVCPHSNHLLIPTALAALRARHGGQHPLRVLQQAGVHAVVGSDDPTPMGTSFRDEWARAVALGADEARLAADAARRWAQLTGATKA